VQKTLLEFTIRPETRWEPDKIAGDFLSGKNRLPADTPSAYTLPPTKGRTQVIFVFEVHVKAGYSAEQYATAWVEASEIIQTAPGARGTRLHRKIGDPNVLVAIASWDSKTARDAAESERDPRVEAIINAQSEFVEIRLIGEFQDPDWVVQPPG